MYPAGSYSNGSFIPPPPAQSQESQPLQSQRQPTVVPVLALLGYVQQEQQREYNGQLVNYTSITPVYGTVGYVYTNPPNNTLLAQQNHDKEYPPYNHAPTQLLDNPPQQVMPMDENPLSGIDDSNLLSRRYSNPLRDKAFSFIKDQPAEAKILFLQMLKSNPSESKKIHLLIGLSRALIKIPEIKIEVFISLLIQIKSYKAKHLHFTNHDLSNKIDIDIIILTLLHQIGSYQEARSLCQVIKTEWSILTPGQQQLVTILSYKIQQQLDA